MELKVIAYARNGHTDKFGIPRQSREESPILTRIVFEPEYNVREALRGIEGYSHLWLLWGFSEVQRSDVRCTKDENNVQSDNIQSTKEWSPTVRPPRLGGNKRVGVFATRSPFRPNPIGLSSVRLLKAYPRPLPEGKGVRWELLVSGADVLDGTPIYDIKPYLSFSDSHPDAENGFADETKEYHLDVVWENINRDQVKTSTGVLNDSYTPPADIQREIAYILSQDPRPAYQDNPQREYKMDYGGWRVTFCVEKDTIFVKKTEKNKK